MTTTNDQFRTEQEKFWAGSFGDAYIGRNEATPATLSGNLFFFTRALNRLRSHPKSVVELGANIGLNLRALRLLFPDTHLCGVEINDRAVARLHADSVADDIVHGSILDYAPSKRYELTLIKGVMIHLNPEALPQVYRTLAQCSSRYVLMAEYYNRRAEEVLYRGHGGKLFRRDFGGEFMAGCAEFDCIDYGFSYHRDPREQQDDLTWFLFERKS